MDQSELRVIAARERNSWKPCRILCCNSTGCHSARSLEVMANLKGAVDSAGVGDRVQVVGVGCIGFCSRGPLVAVSEPRLLYQYVTPEQAASIVAGLDGG